MVCSTGARTAAMASPSVVDETEGKTDNDNKLPPTRGDKTAIELRSSILGGANTNHTKRTRHRRFGVVFNKTYKSESMRSRRALKHSLALAKITLISHL
jgi:hypothetical protein